MTKLFESANILQPNSQVMLYGAGNIGHHVYTVLARHDIQARCFLDRRAEPGAHWQDIPILSPVENILTLQERALPIVISIFNREADVPQIARQLSELGYGPFISFVDLHALFPDELGDHFWLTGRDYYARCADLISQAGALWADETSAQLYREIIDFRRTGDYDRLPLPTGQTQYLPQDIPHWPPMTPLRLVDCGAFDGDTLAVVAQAAIPTDAIAAFEPDLDNFRRLADYARACQPALREGIALWPCGVAARTEMLRFAVELGEASHLDPEGSLQIPCVALDDVVVGFRPNLIKMDIEGAEADALQGAKRLIHQYRPGLAICVYHRPGHLWEIPLALADWRLDYRFYLRAHAHNGFDLVLYAAPT